MDLQNKMSIACDIFLFLFTATIDIIHTFLKSMIPRKYRCKKIDNEIVLITGGAGGLGRLLSIELAALGAHVVIWDINESGIKKVVDEIKSLNGKYTGYVCDITDKQDIYKKANIIKKEIGNINKTFLPEMMKNNHGHIVTISSVVGLGGAYRLTGYSATKFSANGYHNSLFADLKIDGYDGIQTTLVCPYFFHTVGLFPAIKPRFPDALDPNYLAEEIVCGILTNKKTIVLPGYLKFIFPLIDSLPTKSYVKFIKKICKADELSESFDKYQKSMLKND